MSKQDNLGALLVAASLIEDDDTRERLAKVMFDWFMNENLNNQESSNGSE